jgi:hypothetical protein
MVKAVLLARSDIYKTPALDEFSGNSGNVINMKIQQLLKKFSNIPGAATIVAEEVAALTKTKKSTTPTKPKAKPTTPKKRKVKDEGESELDDY